MKLKEKAFTLIELLIVIAIIAILAAAVIIAINPGEQLAKTRDATRERHVKALESALYVYQYDNAVFPTGITSTLTEICNTNIEGVVCGGLVNLSSLELASIPVDPQGGVDENGTGYTIATVNDRLLIDAQKAETRLVDININGLVGWWKLDHNAENIAVDSSGYGNHGTGHGGVTIGGATDRMGQANMATEFDGVDDYVQTEENDLFRLKDKGSVSVWYRHLGSPTHDWTNIISNTPTAGHIAQGWNIYIMLSGEIGGRFNTTEDDTDWNTIISNPEVGEWYHLVITWDNGVSKGYLDGGEIYTSSYPGDLKDNNQVNMMAYIDHNRYANGSLDDVRIYKRALSESEIQSLYNQGL